MDHPYYPRQMAGHSHPYNNQQMQHPSETGWQQPNHHPSKQFPPNQGASQNHDRSWKSAHNNPPYHPGYPPADGERGTPPRREAGGPDRVRFPASGYHNSGFNG